MEGNTWYAIFSVLSRIALARMTATRCVSVDWGHISKLDVEGDFE